MSQSASLPVAAADGAADVVVPAVREADDGLPERFGRNVSFNYLTTAAAGLAALIVTPLLLRHLGREAFGVWALAGSLVGYLELLELGFGGAAIKLVAEDAGRRPNEVARTLNTSLCVLALLGVVALVCGLVIAAVAPSLFSLQGDLGTHTTLVIVVLSGAVAISVPADLFDGALIGFQRFDLSGAANTLMVVLTAVATVAVVILDGGIIPLAIATAAVSVAMHPLRWTLVRRVMPSLRLGKRFIDRARMKAMAQLSGWFMLAEVAQVVIVYLDVVVAGVVLGVEEAAVFAVGSKMAQLAQKALRQLTLVFLPHASQLAKEGEREKLKAQLLDGTRTAMLIGVSLSLVLGLLATGGIRAWVGPGYNSAAAVLMVFALSTALQSTSSVAMMRNMGTAHVREVSLFAAAEAVVNLVLSVLLAHRFGVVGVALGTLVATATVNVPSMLVIAMRDLGVTLMDVWRRTLRPHVVPILATTGSLLAVRRLGEHGTLAVIGLVCLGLLIYAICYFVLGASRAERRRLGALATPLKRVTPGRWSS